MLDLGRAKRTRRFVGIENGELSGVNPPTLRRLQLWKKARITIEGRPDWLFIKLHCHGLQAADESAMIGPPIQQFLRELIEGAGDGSEYLVHFVTMREMANIALAACDDRSGNPGEYRDYRFKLNRAGI